jgi:hypothetical protein
MAAKTITKSESEFRKKENAKIFPMGLIDIHNENLNPCECCKEDSTKGNCFEDSDGAHICNKCFWVRKDRLIN